MDTNTTTPAAATDTKKPTLDVDEYRALQPFRRPTSARVFAYAENRLVEAGLADHRNFDAFREYEGEGLCLPVPPPPKGFDMYQLMSLIRIEGKIGQCVIDPDDITDRIEVPSGMYMMTGIDDGRLRLNTSPSVSWGNIITECRFPCTAWMGFIHALVFPQFFYNHRMDIVGSRFGTKSTPNLLLVPSGPKLSAYPRNNPDPQWGAASCEFIILPNGERFQLRVLD